MSVRAEPSWLLIAVALVPVLIELAGPDAIGAPPALPATGPGFTSAPLPLTATEESLLARAPASKRAYRVDGRALFVLALDATADRHAIHDASYCLRGKGWEIVRDEVVPVPSGEVRLLDARRAGAVRRSISYFESDGRRYTSSFRYLVAYVQARCWPGSRAVRYTVAVTTDPAADGAWIASTALPRIFGGGW